MLMFDYFCLFLIDSEGEDGTAMAEYAILLAVAIVLFMAVASMNDTTASHVDDIALDLDAASLPVTPIS